MTSKNGEHSIPNGGYGWVVVIASFFSTFFIMGNLYSFGVFFPVYLDVFHESEGNVSWVGAIGPAVMCGFGVYTGFWSDKYGNGRVTMFGSIFIFLGYFLASYSTKLWHLYLTQGFVLGVGFSISYIGGISAVNQWFTTLRGLAVGIAMAGSGLGQFVMTMVTAKLLAAVGWRRTLQYLAIITAGGLILSGLAIKRNLPLADGKSAVIASAINDFKNRNFLRLYVACVFGALGMFMPFNFIVRYSVVHGISKSQGYVILSIMGITSAAGRILLGLGADRFGKLLMFRMCLFFSGISTMAWIFCTVAPSVAAYGAIFAFFIGGILSLIPAVTTEMFGIHNISTRLGLLYTSIAVGSLLSAPIGGMLFDSYGNYTPSIAVNGSFLIVGFFLSMTINEKTFKFVEKPTVVPTCDVEFAHIDDTEDRVTTFHHEEKTAEKKDSQVSEVKAYVPLEVETIEEI